MMVEKAPILTDEEAYEGISEHYWDDMPEGTSRHDWANRATQNDFAHEYYMKIINTLQASLDDCVKQMKRVIDLLPEPDEKDKTGE